MQYRRRKESIYVSVPSEYMFNSKSGLTSEIQIEEDKDQEEGDKNDEIK